VFGASVSVCEYISFVLMSMLFALAEKLPIAEAGFGSAPASGGATNMLPVLVHPVAVGPVTPGCSKPGFVISELFVCSLPAWNCDSGSCVPLLARASVE